MPDAPSPWWSPDRHYDRRPFLMARNRMQGFNPVPEQTVDTLKEDVQWIKQQRS